MPQIARVRRSTQRLVVLVIALLCNHNRRHTVSRYRVQARRSGAVHLRRAASFRRRCENTLIPARLGSSPGEDPISHTYFGLTVLTVLTVREHESVARHRTLYRRYSSNLPHYFKEYVYSAEVISTTKAKLVAKFSRQGILGLGSSSEPPCSR